MVQIYELRLTGPSTSTPSRLRTPVSSGGLVRPQGVPGLGVPDPGIYPGGVPQPSLSSAPGEEIREVGHVKWRIYRIYVGAIGPLLATVILVSLVLMQVCTAQLKTVLYWLKTAQLRGAYSVRRTGLRTGLPSVQELPIKS
jgi:hypothetical protein